LLQAWRARRKKPPQDTAEPSGTGTILAEEDRIGAGLDGARMIADPTAWIVGTPFQRIGQDGGHERGLAGCQLGRAGIEIDPRRRFRTIDTLPPFDLVEVELKDTLLRYEQF